MSYNNYNMTFSVSCPQAEIVYDKLRDKSGAFVAFIIQLVHLLDSESSFGQLEGVRVIFCLWAVQMTRMVRRAPHFGVGIV